MDRCVASMLLRAALTRDSAVVMESILGSLANKTDTFESRYTLEELLGTFVICKKYLSTDSNESFSIHCAR